MSKNIRRYYYRKFNVVLVVLAFFGLSIQTAHGRTRLLVAANTPTSEDSSGFDSLVSNLRSNPVNIQELLAKPKAAPAAATQQQQRQTRSASRTPSDTDAVTPYTDSFFSSQVSPY